MNFSKWSTNFKLALLRPAAVICLGAAGTCLPGFSFAVAGSAGSQPPRALVVAALVMGGLGTLALTGGLISSLAAEQLAADQLKDYLERRVVPAPAAHGFGSNELINEVHALCERVELERVTLERDAASDPMSGLLNRRGASIRLSDLIEQARSSKTGWSVALVDLDRLKSLNDTYGHAVGDRALNTLSAALRECSPRNSVIARWGGDEFLIAALVEPDVLQNYLHQLPAALRQAPIITREGPVPVTASVGVAAAAFQDPVDEVIDRADAALYQAKLSGGDQVIGPYAIIDQSRTDDPPPALVAV